MDPAHHRSPTVIAIRALAVCIGAVGIWLLVEVISAAFKSRDANASSLNIPFQLVFDAISLFVIDWLLFVALGGLRQLTDGSIHRLCGAVALVVWLVACDGLRKLEVVPDDAQTSPSWFIAAGDISLLVAATASLGTSRFLIGRLNLVDAAAIASHKRAVERWLGCTIVLLWASLPFAIMSHMKGHLRSLPDEPWDLAIPIGSAVVAWIIYKVGVRALSFPTSMRLSGEPRL